MPFIYQAKLFVQQLSGFSFDDFHVFIGVGIQILVAGLHRYRQQLHQGAAFRVRG
jgi:hypothetical protein